MGDNTHILTGGTPSTRKKEFWFPKEILWMSSGEVNKKRIKSTDNMISKKGFDNSSANWIKPYSILIALAGQGKTRGTVAINEVPLTTNQSIAAIEPNEKISSEFLYQNLNNRYNELRLKSSGDGTRGGLNKKIISNLPVLVPSIDEQEIIGLFFKKIDETLTLLQQKNDTLKQLKKAFLQKLFPLKDKSEPEFRITGYSSKWKINKLNKLVNYSNSKYSSNKLHETTNVGEYPVFDANNTVGWIDDYDITNEYLSIIKDGAGVGRMTKRPGKSSVIGTMGYLSTTGSSIDFIHAILQKVNFSKYIVGSTIPHIYFKDYGNIKIQIPSENEQEKIGYIFKDMDENILLLESKIEFYKQTKKGFLQKMFV